MTYSNSQAQSGRGMSLSIGSGTPVLIGEIRSISQSGNTWETSDVTNMQSGFTKEFISTILDSGELELTCNYIQADAGQAAVETAFEGTGAGTLNSFTWQFPKTTAQTTAGNKFVFNALVQSSNISGEPTKEMTITIRLKISGAKNFTLGS